MGFLGFVGYGGIREFQATRAPNDDDSQMRKRGKVVTFAPVRDFYVSAGKQYVISVNLSFAKT